MRDLLFALHFYFISPVLTLVFVVVLAYAVMSWLFTLGIIQGYNPTARNVYSFLQGIVEPLIRPVRQIVPPLGQLDLSLFVFVLALLFTRDFAIPRIIALIPF